MTETDKRPAGSQSQKVDGFDIREGVAGTWEVIDAASGHPIQIAGIPLSRLSHDEAHGAVQLLHAEAIKPDQSG